MKLWLSIFIVTSAAWAMKASGPLALGSRRLPESTRGVVSLMAPVLLAALIIVELGGPGWTALNWQQVTGVVVAGAARMAKAPMLLAILCGVACTCLLRLL
ncbi:AzlD domain-containing protein [Arthrobacter subterraneus]|uniref:AzlD domain-containing protein n=1 Tax=Arthrobacter subterraneus TaxID=335973 RepID=UPI003800FCD1